MKRGHLALDRVPVPLILQTKNVVKFSPLFHALVKNVTHFISVLTAILTQFFMIFEKTFRLCSIVAGDTRFVIQKAYKSGIFRYVSDTKTSLKPVFRASPCGVRRGSPLRPSVDLWL